MEIAIFEKDQVIGKLELSSDGLFWQIHGKVHEVPEKLRRIYALWGLRSEYLGIPDRQGILKTRISKTRLPQSPELAMASSAKKGDWAPWQGTLDGVRVDEIYVKREQGQTLLAFPSAELVKFPAWGDELEKQWVFDAALSVLRLTENERLPMIEKKLGGQKDEEMFCNDPDAVLFADADTHDSNGDLRTGGEGAGGKADRPDL